MSFSVNFIQGDDQDTATAIVQYSDVSRVPLFGEEVRISSTENEYGETVSELPFPILESVVQRISFTYDEYRDPDKRRHTCRLLTYFSKVWLYDLLTRDNNMSRGYKCASCIVPYSCR